MKVKLIYVLAIIAVGAWVVIAPRIICHWMQGGPEEKLFVSGMAEVDKLTAEIELHGEKYKHSLSHVVLPRERYNAVVEEARGTELGRIFTEGWETNIYIWTIPVYPYDGNDTVFGFDLSEPNEASYKAWFGWE